MRVQHILLVGLFRRLHFVLQAMAIVPVHSCHVHMRSSIHLQASKQWRGNVCHLRLGILDYFFGLMYSKGNGLCNKAEVTLIAHCVLVKLIHPVQFEFISFSSQFGLSCLGNC